MIGKHAPTVHVLSILLLTVGSVITYTELTTSTQASPSAARAAQTASLPLFLPAVSYDPGGSGQAGDFRTVAVADVNGDERRDVAVTNFWTHTVGVLLGNGDGTFRPAVTYSPGGANPTAIAIADVSGDGHPGPRGGDLVGRHSGAPRRWGRHVPAGSQVRHWRRASVGRHRCRCKPRCKSRSDRGELRQRCRDVARKRQRHLPAGRCPICGRISLQRGGR